MRAVVQRVTRARVTVGERVTGEIGHGFLVFVGVANDDGPADVQYIARKIRDLRVFEAPDASESPGAQVSGLQGAPRVNREAGHSGPPRSATSGVQGAPRVNNEARMNHSLADVGGAVLVVSQFTLYADCRKGRRPSFDAAAPARLARALYEGVVQELRASGLQVETGDFQADMQVELVNDGPVTMLVDSRKQF